MLYRKESIFLIKVVCKLQQYMIGDEGIHA